MRRSIITIGRERGIDVDFFGLDWSFGGRGGLVLLHFSFFRLGQPYRVRLSV